MTLLLRAYVPQDVIKAWRLVLLGSYLYHSVLGFWFHKSQCSLFSCPSLMEGLKRSSGGLVPPVWWRIPVLKTQRRWKNSSYLLRNPYLLKEGFCSLYWWWDEMEKTSCCQSWAQWSRGPCGCQFMDLMAQRTCWRGIGVGELTGRDQKNSGSLLWIEF